MSKIYKLEPLCLQQRHVVTCDLTGYFLGLVFHSYDKFHSCTLVRPVPSMGIPSHGLLLGAHQVKVKPFSVSSSVCIESLRNEGFILRGWHLDKVLFEGLPVRWVVSSAGLCISSEQSSRGGCCTCRKSFLCAREVQLLEILLIKV